MIRLYWTFYKSLLLYNVAFSIPASVIFTLNKYLSLPDGADFRLIPYFFNVFPVVLLTGGIAFGLGYTELYKRNQYYFYYNRSLSRIKLFLSALFINSFIGITILILTHYVQHT